MVKLYAVQGSELIGLGALGSGAKGQDVHTALAGVPSGVYSALRSYHRYCFLRLDAHMQRCRQSIERAGYQGDFDLDGLRRAIDTAVRAYPAGDVRIRFDCLERPWPQREGLVNLLLAIAPHDPIPAEVLDSGAHLELAPAGLQREQPLIKFTSWVRKRSVCLEEKPDAYEHLLLDDTGGILEGTSSNFFAVRAGTLITAGDGTLKGITQRLVIELAEGLGYTTHFEHLPLVELERCDEAFITSSTREIVPVSQVAGTPIGSGAPGPVVQALRTEYAAYAEQHAAPAWPAT